MSFDDRVAAVLDLDLVAVMKSRSNVIPARCSFGQRRKCVQRSKSTGRTNYAFRFVAGGLDDLAKKLDLYLSNPVLSGSDLLFPFLQRRRREAFSICECLPPFVVIGDA